MSQYIKGYGITASPLHGLTKKAGPFPKPWVKGEDYDLSFESLRSAILDSANFLHHKDCTERLFIEVDARRKKAEEGKATPALEWSFNEPAKRGRPLS
jgi:hypothetical protein